MKRTFLWLLGLLMTVQVMAQNRTVSGTVTDGANGEPLIGVSVIGKGTSIGTVTDIDGKYSLSVPKDVKELEFQYIGYTTITKTIIALTMDVTMTSEENVLEQVEIVGSYGISTNKGEVSYSNAQVKSEDLATSGSPNALSALQGKVAGLKINKSGGNINSSTRVVLRGESSFSGNNNALIVVDGVIVNNSAFSGGDNSGASNVDYGNRGNDINPDDIETITVLKGPAATTLYGSAGNGGVIMITTKGGKGATQKMKVNYGTSFTVESPYILFQRQDQFGQGLWANTPERGTIDLGENFSWGPRLDGVVRPWTSPVEVNGVLTQLERPYSNIDNQLESFFNTGTTWTNNLSFEGGVKDKFSYYASFNYVDNKGIVPNTWMKRYGFTVNANAQLSEKLALESSVKYIKTNQRGNIEGASFTTNPAYFTALQTPVNIPFNELRDYNSPYHDFTGYYGSYTVNPYYFLDNYVNINEADNLIGTIALKFKPMKDLELVSRVGNNFVIGNTYESVPVYSYAPHDVLIDLGGGLLGFSNRDRSNNSNVGSYNESFNKLNVLDLNNYANYKKNWDKFSIGLIGGVNINDFSQRSVTGSTQGGLVTPGFYNLSNSIETPQSTNTIGRSRTIRTYGSMNVGLWNALYLEYSAANEWSSTLPSGNRGFFYQSGGLSFIVSEFFKTKWVNNIKLRANVGTQGNGAPRYALSSVYVANPTIFNSGNYNVQFPFAGIPGFTTGNTIGNPDLTPEKSITYEGGIDVDLLENRLGVEYTYYHIQNKSLIVNVSLPSSSGFTRTIVNVGQMTNKGHELTVRVSPIKGLVKDFNWDLNFNFTKNKNNVDKITDDVDEISLSTGATQVIVKEGYPFGTFKSEQYKRDDQGRIVVGATGIPVVDANQTYYGSYQPKYTMGASTNLSWKGLSFNILFDIKRGGIFYSQSKFYGDFNGTSLTSTENDRAPWVVPNSVLADGTQNTTPIGDVSTYWANLPDNVNLIDASFVKLREVGLHYSLPAKVFNNSVVSGISVGFVGYNLKFWLPEENQYADPEVSSFGLNGNVQSFETASNPPSRSMGVDFKITF